MSTCQLLKLAIYGQGQPQYAVDWLAAHHVTLQNSSIARWIKVPNSPLNASATLQTVWSNGTPVGPLTQMQATGQGLHTYGAFEATAYSFLGNLGLNEAMSFLGSLGTPIGALLSSLGAPNTPPANDVEFSFDYALTSDQTVYYEKTFSYRIGQGDPLVGVSHCEGMLSDNSFSHICH